MADTFNPGDRVYTVDGAECSFVATVDGGFVMRRVYVIDDEEGGVEELGDVEVVDRVFAVAPTAKRSEDVARLEKQVHELCAEVGRLQVERSSLARAQAEHASALEEHKAVARVVDFIRGKITHFAARSYGEVEVLTRDEAIRYAEKDLGGRSRAWDGRSLKLLTLYGNDAWEHRQGRGLSWRLSHYSDGSGGSVEVMPCQSREEALEVAREWLAEIFTKEIGYHSRPAVKSADALGIPVPEAYREKLRESELHAMELNVAHHEAALAEARAKLAAAKGGQ